MCWNIHDPDKKGTKAEVPVFRKRASHQPLTERRSRASKFQTTMNGAATPNCPLIGRLDQTTPTFLETGNPSHMLAIQALLQQTRGNLEEGGGSGGEEEADKPPPLFQYNVCGWNTKKATMTGIRDKLKPDVCVFQETGLIKSRNIMHKKS